MKTIIIYQISILLIFGLGNPKSAIAQNGEIILNFSGDNNGQIVELDSVWIKNLTQGCDTILYGPDFSITIDTILTVLHQSMNPGNEFQVFQNYPNPFIGSTNFTVCLAQDAFIEIIVFNILGQKRNSAEFKTSKGNNVFLFQSGSDEVYFVSVRYKSAVKTIRMISAGKSTLDDCKLSYVNNENTDNFKSIQVVNYFDFNPGDQLLFVGNASMGESGITDSPSTNMDYSFQFATNIPCIGVPTVDYEGQIYNTIQIYSQCWFKENLNVGEMIPATQSQTNNNIIEKYCPVDGEYYCNNFAGALYQWDEMMNYAYEPQGQGICPDGWHIPTDTDWKVLEGAADSNYGIGNPEWDNIDWRGSDAGGNLKQTGTTNWMSPNTGATDAFGFSALPGGYVVQNEYWGGEWKGYFWSSHTTAHYFRNMDWNQVMIKRGNGVGGGLAISVRCVKD
ncbi:MAG: T9SS type A sorting domain-containing protein [Bacteroidales bacterium]|nr:T9SS type A sorting domain-containing protein [Bacteroidales bacterium]